MKVCCFMGDNAYRQWAWTDESDERLRTLKAKLNYSIVVLVEKYSVTGFISGMAPGTMLFCAQTVLEIKKLYPQVTLECVIPYEDQAARWSEEIRDAYFSVLEGCDTDTLLQLHRTADCIRRRNDYMIAKSDYALGMNNNDLVIYSLRNERITV